MQSNLAQVKGFACATSCHDIGNLRLYGGALLKEPVLLGEANSLYTALQLDGFDGGLLGHALDVEGQLARLRHKF